MVAEDVGAMLPHAVARSAQLRLPLGGALAARPAAVAVYSLIAAWMCFGLFGHDPWKPDEAYTVGLVHHIARTGDWLVPTLAGEPFLEKPPIFFITSALFTRLFGGWLPLHEAARCATVFYVATTLFFVAATARRLYGDGRDVLAVLILIGSIGYVQPAHLLITDNALAAGIAMALYGLALSLERELWAGLLVGTGAGLAFLSKGLIGPGFIGLTAIGLRFLPAWQTAGYLRMLGIAALAFAPWALVWPWLLYLRSPDLFDEWFWLNNLGRFTGAADLGPEQDRLLYLRILPWFALPALPLAAWTAWRSPREPAVQLPLMAAGVMLAVLTAAGNQRYVYAVPLLLALSVLGAARADSAPYWLGWMLERGIVRLAAVLASAMWLAWLALLAGWPSAIVEPLQAERPGFEATLEPWLFAVALATSAAWIALVRGGHAFAVKWAASVTLVWGLGMTLWLPYLDYGNSYRALVAELKSRLPADAGCIANRGLGEPQRAMLEYLGGIVTYPRDSMGPNSGHRCRLLLVQTWQREGSPKVSARWRLIWTGSRAGDTNERYWLYQRIESAGSGKAKRKGPRRRAPYPALINVQMPMATKPAPAT
jgi:4-amino-4-deoxy-L-arabinose transferase-like glycosyltransferase